MDAMVWEHDEIRPADVMDMMKWDRQTVVPDERWPRNTPYWKQIEANICTFSALMGNG